MNQQEVKQLKIMNREYEFEERRKLVSGRVEFLYGERILSEYVKKHSEIMPNKTALNFYGKKISYRELDEQSDRLANAIAQMGYKKGDRIAAFLQPSPQVFMTFLAAMKLGLIIVPVDPMSKKLELGYCLEDSKAKIIVTFDQLYQIVKEVRDEGKIKDVIVTSFHDYLPDTPELPLHPMMKSEKMTFPDTYEFMDLIRNYSPNPPKVEVDLSDDGWILYTGETVGMPKGCLHTHYNALLSGLGGVDLLCGLGSGELGYKPREDVILLASYPLTHLSGIAVIVTPVFYGGMQAIILPRWDAVAAMEAIQKYHVTLTHWTSRQYMDVMNHPDVGKYDFSSLKFCTILPFEKPLTQDMIDEWNKIANVRLCICGYAGTEYFNYCCVNDGSLPFKEHGFGVPAPGVQIKIRDFNTNRELPKGEIGEIVVKSPAQMKEYINKPDATKERLVDGWVYSSDKGMIDQDGILHFLGRQTDTIKPSGYSFSPREVEMMGLQHPAIERIAVIGIPDPKKGKVPKAFVTLKPGFEMITASELEAWFKKNISAFKVPIVEIGPPPIVKAEK